VFINDLSQSVIQQIHQHNYLSVFVTHNNEQVIVQTEGPLYKLSVSVFTVDRALLNFRYVSGANSYELDVLNSDKLKLDIDGYFSDRLHLISQRQEEDPGQSERLN